MDLSCFSTLISGFSWFFFSETLVIPQKNVDGLTIMEIVTQSVGEHDHQVPLQLSHIGGRAQFYPGGAKRDSKRVTTPLKHPAIEEITFNNRKLRFKSPQMRPLQIPSSVWGTIWLNITIQ